MLNKLGGLRGPFTSWQGHGEIDPYAAYDAAYDFRTASGYMLNTGRVETAYNLGTGGSGYDITQATSADRPTIGAMTDTVAAGVFTTGGEWLGGGSLATIMNSATASFRITIIFENNNIATQQALVTWSLTGSNNGYMLIATDGTGDIRIRRRSVDGLNDVAVDSAVKITANTTQTLTLEFGSGLVSGFMNGVAAFTNIDYIGAVGALNCDTFTIGSRVTTAGALGWEGLIAFIGVELL